MYDQIKNMNCRSLFNTSNLDLLNEGMLDNCDISTGNTTSFSYMTKQNGSACKVKNTWQRGPITYACSPDEATL